LANLVREMRAMSRRVHPSHDGAASFAEARARAATRGPDQSGWLTVPEAAALVGVSNQTIMAAWRRGELVFPDVQGTHRVDPDAVRAWARRLRLIA
jgi:excisionase family DNA binding protein